jgi:signal transduction histidine kinase
LGLPIAKALIEAQGGEIWLESPIPGWDGEGPPGTRATIAVPLFDVL